MYVSRVIHPFPMPNIQHQKISLSIPTNHAALLLSNISWWQQKKQGPPLPPSWKASLPMLPAPPAAPTETPPAPLELPSPPAFPSLLNFSDINGDSQPNCPLTQEFLPVPSTTFSNAHATMFGNSAIKSAEASAPLHCYNEKILASKNLFIQPDYMELCNHISSNFTMIGKIAPQFKTKGNRRGKDNEITYHIEWDVKDISHDIDDNHLIKPVARNSTLFDELVEARKVYDNLPNNAKKKNKNKANLMELNPSNHRHQQSIKRSPPQLVNFWVIAS